MKLYEITNIMRALLDTLSDRALNEAGPDAEQDHEHAMQAFEQTTEDMDAKLRSVIAYSLELDAQVEARMVVIDRMVKANQRDQAKAVWLRDYAKGAIQAVNMPLPRKYPEFTLSLAKVPRVAEIVDEAAVPARYKTKIIPEPVVKIDKAAINKDARDGEVIPGVRLAPQTYRLTVK
jgi:hypothetical protein